MKPDCFFAVDGVRGCIPSSRFQITGTESGAKEDQVQAGTVTYRTLGREVVDAARDPKPIRITAADIRGAVCKSRTQCAIARAIKRSTGAPWVEVRNAVIYVGTSPEQGRRYRPGLKRRKPTR